MARSGRTVDEVIECRGIGSDEASERLLRQSAADYRAVGVGTGRFQLVRTYRPTWAVVVGCALTPVLVGLPFFFVRRTEAWEATVEEDHRFVRVRITGTVSSRVLSSVRRAIQQGSMPVSADAVAQPVDPAPRQGGDGRDPGTGLLLCFDTGECHPVVSEMLVGRDPAASDGCGPTPALVAVTDPDLSVSKTHLLLRGDALGVTVVDRGSVNGTAVEDARGVLTPVTEGVEVHAGVGATIRFGARSILVTEPGS